MIHSGTFTANSIVKNLTGEKGESSSRSHFDENSLIVLIFSILGEENRFLLLIATLCLEVNPFRYRYSEVQLRGLGTFVL